MNPLRLLAVCLSLAASVASAQQCQPGWSPLGDGLNGTVRALAVFDDGSGPALYAGGDFTLAGGKPAGRIARWDGAAWSTVGAGDGADNSVRVLQAFDDGSGPALYAFGSFSAVDGVPAVRAARWDGHAWSQAGNGLPGGTAAAEVFDDGEGPALYIGGRYYRDHTVYYAARLDGPSWTMLGGLKGSWISDLCVPDLAYDLLAFDDGSGPALFAAGRLDSVDGVPSMNVARWAHGAWEPNPGLGDQCTAAYTLEAADLGDGPRLLATGGFGLTLYGWDGLRWSAIPAMELPDFAWLLRTYDDGAGPALYAGLSSEDGDPVRGVARWDGAKWVGVGGGLAAKQEERVFALQSFHAALYAAGTFDTAGDKPAANIARWGCPPVCPGDCDGSGVLDLFDFLCFVNEYNAHDEAGDCTDEGEFDFFDFVCFINLFNGGC